MVADRSSSQREAFIARTAYVENVVIARSSYIGCGAGWRWWKFGNARSCFPGWAELSSDRTLDWLHLCASCKVSKHSLNLINGALLERNWIYVQIRTCKHPSCISVTWIPASLHSRCVMWWGNCLTSARADASPCLKSRMLWDHSKHCHLFSDIFITYVASGVFILSIFSLQNDSDWLCTCNTLFYSSLLFKRLVSNLCVMSKLIF